MTTITAEVVAHSITEDGREISSIITESPLSYHAQNMTHREFSRNSASSRAIRTNVLSENITNNPVHPVKWSKNQSGMQGLNDLSQEKSDACKHLWDYHRSMTLFVVEQLNFHGLHKQYANRLLTPHQHIKVLWTTVNWKNYLRLRDHEDAQPEEQVLSKAIRDALSNSKPKLLKHGEWHLPFIREEDWHLAEYEIVKKKGLGKKIDHNETLELLKNISASRCATLSYNNADGSPSTFEKDLIRIKKLMVEPLHASPFEHQATPDKKIRVDRRQVIMSEIFPDTVEEIIDLGTRDEWEHPELHGNLKGFIQYRKTLPNEFLS